MILSPGKVYELALSTIKPDHVSEFLGGYIPQILPVMAEYGGRFVINGSVERSVAGAYAVGSFAFLEWPSIDAFTAIASDQRVQPLFDRRNHCLEVIHEGWFYGVTRETELPVGQKNRHLYLRLSADNGREPGMAVRLMRVDHPHNLAPGGCLDVSANRLPAMTVADIDTLVVVVSPTA